MLLRFGVLHGECSTACTGKGGGRDEEEDSQVFAPDARTLYLGAGYEIGSVALVVIYGETRYDDAGGTVKENEWNLLAGYEIIENLELELIYAKVDNNDRADSYYAVKTGLTYRF